MKSLAFVPADVLFLTSSRRMSPTEMWTRSYCARRALIPCGDECDGFGVEIS